MNYQLKQNIDSIYCICDAIEKNGINIDSIELDGPLRNVLRTELTLFLLYLAASDSQITWQETSFLNNYLGWELSTADIKTLVRDNEICSTKFEDRIPLILQIFLGIDNLLFTSNQMPDAWVCETLLCVFEMLGNEFLACDDQTSDIEILNFTIYIANMRKYIAENLLAKQNHTIQQQPEPVNAPPHEVAALSEETLESLLSQLHSLTGLSAVKTDVTSLINLLQIRKIREERGLKPIPVSLHLVFSGNPGTGKTTVARLLAKIYHRLGVLSKGHLVEVDRSGLVGGYVGQTAIKVQEVIQKSLGGVLFIDEAYSLTANKGENDYGLEAIDTLLKGMEDHREDFVVIVAGYPKLMDEFLNSNPGLRSRFNKHIYFSDYTPPELVAIFDGMCSNAGYIASNDCMEYVKRHFEELYLNRNENFANGRAVRNFFETAMVNQANRLTANKTITTSDLTTFVLADVESIRL